jgi:hypothetical protein
MQIEKCKMQNRLTTAAIVSLSSCLLFVLLQSAHVALAQESPPAATPPEKPAVKQKLLERKPFDLVVLKPSACRNARPVHCLKLAF